MKASKEFISDLARKSLNGDQRSYRLLMQVLEKSQHPIVKDIDRRVGGIGVAEAVLLPLSRLVLDYPKPVVYSRGLAWNGPGGRLHNGTLPAEIWFEELYISYAVNGKPHRSDGKPAVIDVAGDFISYFENGEARLYGDGPFRVESHEGSVMLTYVLGERDVVRKGTYAQLQKPGQTATWMKLRGWDDDDGIDSSEVSLDRVYDKPGAHVVVTREFVDIEGLGKSDPTEADVKNLNVWTAELDRQIEWAKRYIEEYLNKFK